MKLVGSYQGIKICVALDPELWEDMQHDCKYIAQNFQILRRNIKTTFITNIFYPQQKRICSWFLELKYIVPCLKWRSLQAGIFPGWSRSGIMKSRSIKSRGLSTSSTVFLLVYAAKCTAIGFYSTCVLLQSQT